MNEQEYLLVTTKERLSVANKSLRAVASSGAIIQPKIIEIISILDNWEREILLKIDEVMD